MPTRRCACVQRPASLAPESMHRLYLAARQAAQESVSACSRGVLVKLLLHLATLRSQSLSANPSHALDSAFGRIVRQPHLVSHARKVLSDTIACSQPASKYRRMTVRDSVRAVVKVDQ